MSCQAWGDGAAEFLESLPALLGADDDTSDFCPQHPVVEAAHRRVPHLRLGRTHRVLEALIPAVLEQQVPGADAFRSWRLLVTKFGTAARDRRRKGCGSRPPRRRGAASRRGSFTAPTSIPAGARTVVGCAQRASALERLSARSADEARSALTALPGVGVWTAAETTQRALGDADALSIGDYHLAAVIGWTLVGEPLDDSGMVELMEPMRPHRYRVVRLLEASDSHSSPGVEPGFRCSGSAISIGSLRVEIALDQSGDGADDGLVFGSHSDPSAVARTQGHDHQRGPRIHRLPPSTDSVTGTPACTAASAMPRAGACRPMADPTRDSLCMHRCAPFRMW